MVIPLLANQDLTPMLEGVSHKLLSLFFVGATRGLDEIKEQPFFKTIDFDVS